MIKRVLAGVVVALLVAACASQGTSTGTAAHAPAPNASAVSAPAISAPPIFAPVISSPAPALSSPADVGSETPQPLPTPSFGSEGTLPPMPPGGRTLDTSDPDSALAAQDVIIVFAQEVAAVAQNAADYCNVAIDVFHDGMTVWWHGTPTAAVSGVLDRARRAGIKVAVLPTPIERAPLNAAMATVSDRMQELGLDEVSVSNDCSGLSVGMVTLTPDAEAAAQAFLGPQIPLKFEQTGPIWPA